MENQRERAQALINIAAPEFRDELRAEYIRLYGSL
jgi:acyl-CoA hydrolase